ncbi:MAG TPA: hypothetical protein VIX90_06540 [Edaphobacter sp.]
MAMRIGDSFGLVAVFASLLLAHSVLGNEYGDSGGTPVFLPHRCTPQQNMNKGDGREILVRYRLDHSSFANDTLMPVEDDLRRVIAGTMSSRQEQVISFAADERLTYGEVSAVLSDLQKDSLDLNIILVTKSQIGSVDGVEWDRLNDLCLSIV